MNVDFIHSIAASLNLRRDTIFFDLETTGRDPIKDRIVQIGVIKINTDGDIDSKSLLINPKIPIPTEASDVHGIYDEDVEDKPTFKSYSVSMAGYFAGCDLAGYNSDSFDVGFLVEAFSRCGIDFPDGGVKLIDALRLERHMNSHKLEEVYKNRTGKTLEDAHDALADTTATAEVFAAQAQSIKGDMGIDLYFDQLADLYSGEDDPDKSFPDFPFNKVYVKDEVPYFNVGKHQDTPIADIPKDYIEWMINNTDNPFPSKTIKFIKETIA